MVFVALYRKKHQHINRKSRKYVKLYNKQQSKPKSLWSLKHDLSCPERYCVTLRSALRMGDPSFAKLAPNVTI